MTKICLHIWNFDVIYIKHIELVGESEKGGVKYVYYHIKYNIRYNYFCYFGAIFITNRK
jgi:hypothetical protein